jgi:hypothetical protein
VSAGEAGTCVGSKRSGSATFASTPLIWAQSSSLSSSRASFEIDARPSDSQATSTVTLVELVVMS